MKAVFVLKVFLFLSVFLLFYRFFLYVSKVKLIETSIRALYKKTKERETDRKEKEQKRNNEDGVQNKRHLLYKIDLLITYSNIQRRFPYINGELFFLCSIFFSALGGLEVWILTELWFGGVASAILIFISFFLILNILSGINYKKTERTLLSFVDLLENYSRSSDDIAYILSQVASYVEEPIRTAIEESYDDCIRIGISQALNKLQQKIEHEKFKDIIRNIEISSRYEANYSEVIIGNRDLLKEYLSTRQKRKTILNNGRREVLILTFIFIFMVYSLNALLSVDLYNLLITTLIGRGILVYCAGVLLLSLLRLFSLGKEK